MERWIARGALLVAAAGAACRSGSDEVTPRVGCAGVGPGAVPGVVIQGPGIDLQVRDPFGRGQAVGTTATVRRTDGTVAPANVQDTLNILAAYDITGTFTVTLNRPYYQDASVSNIVVTPVPNSCAVNKTTVQVTMHLAPGAPPIRALTILGAAFLDHVGAQVQLHTHFDADPSASTAVTWSVNDATLASVDATGLVTAQCTKTGGTAKVTAASVADGSVAASVNLGVAPTASCP
jgi:Bacterial Ig-like domain (group 2)